MNAPDRQALPPSPEQLRDAMLSAAVVLRDVSFLRVRNRCVSLGCRATMREHALQWRRQPFPKGAGPHIPKLDARAALANAA